MKPSGITDLKTFRAKHDLTQARLAELLPVNLRTLQEWESEREKGQPPSYLWRALAHLEAELQSALVQAVESEKG